MKAVLEDGKNIYLQISEAIQDDILAGLIGEEELIPSKNQIAKHFQINPVTALKGVNLLADEGIVYPKRGIGMCVTSGAREAILQKRRRGLYETYVRALIREAEKLGVSKSELIKMIESGETHE
ncbi:MAG: GntR family transcriptional regulator [Oscillospiraceae bacterium]|nr:GntR family transcriptional regulator [Oscillospiraceae bacterium]